MSKIVLSYPYSGSLYAYFENQLYPGRGSENMMDHGYYKTLFGNNPEKMSELALTLTVLYDDILIAPADNAIPDLHEYTTDGTYHNPLMGVKSSWNDFLDKQEQRDDLINKYLEDEVIQKIFNKVPLHAKRQILTYAIYELHLSHENNCPIVCSRGRESIFKRLKELDGKDIYALNTIDANKINLIHEYVDITGVLFNPRDIDTLYETKQNKKIRKYSHDFIKIIDNVGSKENSNEKFRKLINESIDTTDIASRSSGFFNRASILMGVADSTGVSTTGVPLGSLIAAGGSMLINEIDGKNKWYELGPEIKKFTNIQKMKQNSSI